jgi:hypothetical protein
MLPLKNARVCHLVSCLSAHVHLAPEIGAFFSFSRLANLGPLSECRCACRRAHLRVFRCMGNATASQSVLRIHSYSCCNTSRLMTRTLALPCLCVAVFWGTGSANKNQIRDYIMVLKWRVAPHCATVEQAKLLTIQCHKFA